ncbi:hypothetical protein OG800_49755 (plasmid) [Streptomyces sp. NBC_00445]|uniref:hypothetical protein n=1 Tax=Streptomyces sp. NBC_00445 TaxID=2975745 RepID=UPI002E1FFA10
MALMLYAGPFDGGPDQIPVEQLVAALVPIPVGSNEPSIEDVVGQGLAERGHDLDDDSALSLLFRQLTEDLPPLAYTFGGSELTAADHWPGGTLMQEAARKAEYWLRYYYLDAARSA